MARKNDRKKVFAVALVVSFLGLGLGSSHGVCGISCCCEAPTPSSYRAVLEGVCHLENLVLEKLSGPACTMKMVRTPEMAQSSVSRILPGERSFLAMGMPQRQQVLPMVGGPQWPAFPVDEQAAADSEPIYLQHQSLLI